MDGLGWTSWTRITGANEDYKGTSVTAVCIIAVTLRGMSGNSFDAGQTDDGGCSGDGEGYDDGGSDGDGEFAAVDDVDDGSWCLAASHGCQSWCQPEPSFGCGSQGQSGHLELLTLVSPPLAGASGHWRTLVSTQQVLAIGNGCCQQPRCHPRPSHCLPAWPPHPQWCCPHCWRWKRRRDRSPSICLGASVWRS